MSEQVMSRQVKSGLNMNLRINWNVFREYLKDVWKVSTRYLGTGQVRSGQVQTGQVRAGHVRTGHVKTG